MTDKITAIMALVNAALLILWSVQLLRGKWSWASAGNNLQYSDEQVKRQRIILILSLIVTALVCGSIGLHILFGIGMLILAAVLPLLIIAELFRLYYKNKKN